MNEVLERREMFPNSISSFRSDFEILDQTINNRPLVYLDNAATTQKPSCVLQAMNDYYRHDNANIHRGVHRLSVQATECYESARTKIKNFINAEDTHEIIFTKGTTEGINLVASTFGSRFLKEGDEIIISGLEHHSNIVPWQLICERVGAKINVIPVDDTGDLNIKEFESLLTSRTKIIAVTHVSNAIGTINPIKKIIGLAHEKNIPVLVDGAQATPHLFVDVKDLDCDFYVFSSHKMYGPTGVGVLYGKSYWLDRLPPYQGGGDMIAEVSFEKTTYSRLPYKFEAGTPNIAGVVGLGRAIDYLQAIGIEAISAYENELVSSAMNKLREIDGLKIIGSPRHRAAVISFVMDKIHPHDIGTVLDSEGVAIRAGHHCAMPLMTRFNIPATARVSFALYNTHEEIDQLVVAIQNLKRLFE